MFSPGQKSRGSSNPLSMIGSVMGAMTGDPRFGQQSAAPSQEFNPLMAMMGFGMPPQMREKMFAKLSQKAPGMFGKMGGMGMPPQAGAQPAAPALKNTPQWWQSWRAQQGGTPVRGLLG
jgi:hypothetical protein